MNDDLFEHGLEIRKAVLGADYVEKDIAAADDFDTANLDHPVAIIGLKAGGFRIQYYLTH